MFRLIMFISVFVLFATTERALSQENAPAIIPERLQVLAMKIPVADRLGINWSEAGPESVGRYMGFLAAINEVSQRIAKENDRSEPVDADYLAAFASFCIWPPNKPALVQKYWPLAYPAFYSAKVRAALPQVVGPEAHKISAQLQQGAASKLISILPTIEAEYNDKILNLKALPRIE